MIRLSFDDLVAMSTAGCGRLQSSRALEVE